MPLKPVFIDPDNPSQLREPRSGDTFINNPDVSFDAISNLLNYKINQSPRTKTANVMGYYSSGDGGGGTFYWDSSEDKANHNGGTIINPDHNSTIGSTNWYSASGDSTDTTGSGCWVREDSGDIEFKKFGANTNNTASENWNALKVVIEEGFHLIIDDMYKIDPSNGSISLPEDTIIEVLNDSCGFDFSGTSGGTLFIGNSSGNIFSIEGIKLKHDDSKSDPSVTIFTHENDTDYLNEINIKNCSVEGRIRATEVRGDTSLDPSTNDFGIRYIHIKNNKTKNVPIDFARVSHSPSKYIEVKDNEVENLYGTWFSSGLTNGASNEEQLRDFKRECVIEDNNIFNEVSYWPDVTSSYFAFVVYEGVTVRYKNNSVEGLKTKSSVSIYDSYLSAINVFYKGNTWKNNVNFSSMGNQIVQCKQSGLGGTSPTPVYGKKVYKDNNFIVENSWVSDIGESESDAYVGFLNIASGSDFIFKDNELDLIGLDIFTSSEDLNSFSIDDNSFDIEFINSGSGFFNFRRETTFDDIASSIKRNDINITGSSLTDYILFRTSSLYKRDNLSIIGNTGYITDGEVNGVSHLFSDIYSSNIKILRNNITGGFQRTFNNCLLDSPTIDDNNFVSTGYPDDYDFFFREGQNSGFVGEFYINSFVTSVVDTHRLPLYNGSSFSLSNTLRHRVRFKVLSEAGWEQIEFTFDLYYSDPDYHIAYTDASGTDQDRILSSGNGNFDDLEVVTTGSAGFGIRANLLNASTNDSPELRLEQNIPSGRTVNELEISTFEV